MRATNRAVHGDCLSDRVQRGSWVIEAGVTFRDPGFSQTGDHPVACVNWDEARAYVAWLNTQTHGGYRLLTEVEWEYVARAGASQNGAYPWGDDPAEGCSVRQWFRPDHDGDVRGHGHLWLQSLRPTELRRWLAQYGARRLAGPQRVWRARHDRQRLRMGGRLLQLLARCPLGVGFTADNRDRVLTPHGQGRIVGTLAHNLRTAERFSYSATHRDDSIGIRVAKTLR